MRKPNSNSPLDADERHGGFSDDAREELIEAFLGGMSYEDAARFCLENFGMEVSRSALQRFYHRWVASRLVLRRRGGRDMALGFKMAAEEDGELFDEATMARIAQIVFELSIEPKPDTAAIKSLYTLILSGRRDKRDTAALELKIKEAEAREAAARETLGDETLTPEEKARKMRETFGIFG